MSSDDDQEVDEFVSSHGFEFIDGDNDSRARALDLDDDSTSEFFPFTNNSHTSSLLPSCPSWLLGTLALSQHPD